MAPQDIHDRLKEARRQAGYASATEAARAFGWTVSSYLGYENGDREPGKEMARRIAGAYRVSLEWLLTGKEPRVSSDRSVLTIVGKIGAGGLVDVEADQAVSEQIETVIPLPSGAIGFEVTGDSMWPRYDEGDVIVCVERGMPLEQIPDGEEAAVRTADGMRYLKRLLRADVEGLFNLESHNAPPIRGVQIEWASDVTAVIRRNKWRKLTDADRRKLVKRTMAKR